MAIRYPILRRVVILMAIVFWVAGGVVVWGGVEIKNFALMQSFTDNHSDYVGLAVIAFGGTMAIIAILGCIGAWCRIRWCQGVVTSKQFIGFLIWMGLVLLASGAGALYFQGYLEDNLTRTNCPTITNFNAADHAMQEGARDICTYLCPCNFDPALQVEQSAYNRTLVKGSASRIDQCIPCEGLIGLTPAQTVTVNTFLSTYGLNLATCQTMSTSDLNDKIFTSTEQMLFPLLTWMEVHFSCAGMCTSTNMYSFSDVNNGVPSLPTTACFGPLRNWVNKDFPIFGGVGVAFGAFLIVLAVFALCLCCHPNRPGK